MKTTANVGVGACPQANHSILRTAARVRNRLIAAAADRLRSATRPAFVTGLILDGNGLKAERRNGMSKLS